MSLTCSPRRSWGESAGSISVFLHLFANGGDTEGLFRAGMMSSGSSVPTGDITEVQGTYDFVVDQVGCSDTNDTLACLRTVSTDSLLAAANSTPSFLSGVQVRRKVWAIWLCAADSTYRCRAWLRRTCRVPMVYLLRFHLDNCPSRLEWRMSHSSSVCVLYRVEFQYLTPAHAPQGDVKDEGTIFSLGSFNITYVPVFGLNPRMTAIPTS